MSSDDLEKQRQDYTNAGGKVTECPQGAKPKEKTLDYPLSGGRTVKLNKGTGQRERSPAMKLLKLTPKSMQIAPAGAGGIIEVGMAEVAAALGAHSPIHYEVQGDYRYGFADAPAGEIKPVLGPLDKRAYYFALAKYLADTGAINLTIHHAWMAAVDLAIEHHWRIERGSEVLRQASRLALVQHLNHAALHNCHFCGGAGETRKGSCRHCNSTGHRALTAAEMARSLGIDARNYSRTWAKRVKTIFRIIQDWDQAALRHLYFQFSD